MVQRFKPISDDCHITSEFAAGHPGVDFGRDGGSGDQPVFAAQAGLVTHAGAAQGFGGPAPAGWIVIDHPTAAGSGTTVYGSIIAEVAEGEWVHAGQRIARINPDPNTNGGTAPHLHFQVHPFVWQPGSQIDPVAWLDDAPAPTSAQSNPPICYGVDLSNHQPDINLKTIAEEGFEFAILKATEGTWLDPCFQQHYSAAREAGLHTAAYVYVRSETSPQEHADALDNVVRAAAGDMSVPICLDIESGSGTDPDHWRAIHDEFTSRGYQVILTYLPRWYWQQVGSPDLADTGLPPLWSSHYVEPQQGYASAIYQRAGTGGWRSYGGLLVDLWQFSSEATVAGHAIDVNAYLGDPRDLFG